MSTASITNRRHELFLEQCTRYNFPRDIRSTLSSLQLPSTSAARQRHPASTNHQEQKRPRRSVVQPLLQRNVGREGVIQSDPGRERLHCHKIWRPRSPNDHQPPRGWYFQ